MYIRRINVERYRSLWSVELGDLSPVVVLYGNNDTGKSNILAFLSSVFKEKFVEEITGTTTSATPTVQRRPSGFWRGEIEDFADNFHYDADPSITFSMVIDFNRDEILALGSLPAGFLETLRANRPLDHLRIDGTIQPSDGGGTALNLRSASFNNKSFYDSTLTDAERFLPGYDLDVSQKQSTFENIMSTLNNGFQLIPATRFIETEREHPRQPGIELQPEMFKNWLFQTGLDRGREHIFRQIQERFASEPFAHGRISLARIGQDELELFVEGNQGLKLPIGRKGTGVQQILIILSYVIASKAPIVGIEELEVNLSPTAQKLIFTVLHQLVNTVNGPLKQIFLTSHSPHVARRNEAQRRLEWMEKGHTSVSKPRQVEVRDFFEFVP
jgi:hypothetical protein